VVKCIAVQRNRSALAGSFNGKKVIAERNIMMLSFFRKQLMKALLLMVCISSVISIQGCSYMADRGRDALDIMDIGISVTPSVVPDFACYFDFFNATPIGYSHVDGKILGIAYRQVGWLDYESHNWGVLSHGVEKQGTGDFDPDNPHYAHVGETTGDEWPQWDAGFVRLFTGDNPPPPLQHLECSRVVHIGWIGILWDIRPIDAIDFVVGWTTLDMMGDDDVEAPVIPSAAE
jgi:hypothetical protein